MQSQPQVLNSWNVSYCQFQLEGKLAHYIKSSVNMPRLNLSKVILLGDSAVGKTSLLHTFTEDKFVHAYKATVGADFTEQSVFVDGKEVVLEIWDTAGQERFKSLGSAFYRGADCCVLVYDITSAKSFANLELWIEDFAKNGCPREPEKFPFVVVGNKADLEEQREVDSQSVRELLQRHPNLTHLQASAKQKSGVKEIFEKAASESLRQKQDEIFNVYDVPSTNIGNKIGKKPQRKVCC